MTLKEWVKGIHPTIGIKGQLLGHIPTNAVLSLGECMELRRNVYEHLMELRTKKMRTKEGKEFHKQELEWLESLNKAIRKEE